MNDIKLKKESTSSQTDEYCDGVIHFGNVDWWYHNRGHSSIRMATRIAQHVPIVWINSIGMRLPMPGKTEIAWTRYWRKLKSLTRGLKRDPKSGMYIYSPIFVPLYSPAMLKFNGRLLSLQVKFLCRHLKIKHPSALVSMPTMTPAVELGKWIKVVFERCDDFSTLPEADKEQIWVLEKRLLEISDAAAYVHEELMEREVGLVKKSILIGHGVDFEQFVAARPLVGARIPIPDAMRDLPKPIIGFYGGIDDYRMDVELMIKVARHIYPGTLLLIGPKQMDLSKILAEKNVKHIDQIPPDELAAHAAHFDVGIIPFLQNEFNKMCNPIKLKEYLALGYPIVVMQLPAFEAYESLIYTANSHKEFLVGIDKALKESDQLLIEKRRAAVSGSSWDKVAAQVAKLLAVP
ncbi:glycosyltransferase [Candidatus Parabeggiatoa sp. HSG14]|uniref:glycosyltransferase n=1 Tax=Candidatus Parabeggiatoa sp. HSG14 TaxID=3055593 RepID=UPI0025A80CB1|nr:glycosyltransferase [Thiotrichales bacterium HSG14]